MTRTALRSVYRVIQGLEPSCMWLIENFDPVSRFLKAHNMKLFLSPLDVHRILGLPCGKLGVNTKGNYSDIQELCVEYGVSDQGSIPLSSLTAQFQDMKANGVEFKLGLRCVF